jgi:hypothetical protein
VCVTIRHKIGHDKVSPCSDRKLIFDMILKWEISSSFPSTCLFAEIPSNSSLQSANKYSAVATMLHLNWSNLLNYRCNVLNNYGYHWWNDIMWCFMRRCLMLTWIRYWAQKSQFIKEVSKEMFTAKRMSWHAQHVCVRAKAELC